MMRKKGLLLCLLVAQMLGVVSIEEVFGEQLLARELGLGFRRTG